VAPRASFVDSIVERRCPAGHALVLRCRPVRNDRDPVEPFPTLFWLACDAVAAQIARLEYEGGIGGIADRATVKCLHLHYAHHLARGSALGEAIDALGEIRLCDAPSGAPPSG